MFQDFCFVELEEGSGSRPLQRVRSSWEPDFSRRPTHAAVFVGRVRLLRRYITGTLGLVSGTYALGVQAAVIRSPSKAGGTCLKQA